MVQLFPKILKKTEDKFNYMKFILIDNFNYMKFILNRVIHLNFLEFFSIKIMLYMDDIFATISSKLGFCLTTLPIFVIKKNLSSAFVCFWPQRTSGNNTIS